MLGQRLLDRGIASRAVRREVRGDVHAVRPDLAGNPHHLDGRVAVHDVQTLDAVGEVLKESAEVGNPGAGGRAPQPVVEDEQWDDTVRTGVDGSPEGGLVVQSEIASEPHHRRRHGSIVGGERQTCRT